MKMLIYTAFAEILGKSITGREGWGRDFDLLGGKLVSLCENSTVQSLINVFFQDKMYCMIVIILNHYLGKAEVLTNTDFYL